jgi:superfamily II DNA helicase RecQ
MEGCWDARSLEPDEPLGAQHQYHHARSQRTRSRGSAPAATTTPLSLEDMNEQFCYLHTYCVLVCKEHATGVLNLDAHLRSYHSVASEQRRAIVQHFRGRPIKPPQDVTLPTALSPPIEELGQPLDGLACEQDGCSFITVNVDTLRIHAKKHHNVAWKGDTAALYERVKVQTFFRVGGLQRYFVVRAADSSNAPNVSREVTNVVKERLAEWQLTQHAHEERAQVMDAHVAKTDKTGWFKRTGWLEHFANRNLMHLAHQTRLPDRGEVKLGRAAKLTELLVERSVKGLSTLAQETRRWLRSAKRQEVDQRPMARLQNPESQARYAGYMVKFVCYALRVVADAEARMIAQDSSGEVSNEDEDEDDPGSGDDYEDDSSDSDDNRSANHQGSSRKEKDLMKDARELFRWTSRQKDLGVALWGMLDSHANNDNAQLEAQLEVLLNMLASFFFTSTGDKPFSSGLIHFLAVLGIDSDANRLRTAKNYSYMLAGVVYCMRVLSVEHLLPSASRDEQTDEDRERFLQHREKYLADGSYSPMSETLSLLAFGKHVALASGNAGNAYWSKDKKIFYLHGRPIYISRFRKMAQDTVAEAEQMLWEELFWVTKTEERFAVKLEQLIDDVTFERRGVSFVQHRDNGLKDKLEWMLARAEQTEEGRRLQSSDRQWNLKQVKRYLRCVDRFLTLLMVCVHITSGQPGRGSEITTMRHRNGLLQDRNIFVMDGQVMTVVRYHKSQSQWDKPKVVPRFLPPQLGQVMVMYLAYLQPFRDYLSVQVLGGSFSDYVWADEQGPWGTDRLTRALRRETGKRLGVALHTLDYRHTAVGIGRVMIGESFSKGYQDEIGEVDEAEVDEDGEDVMELQNARTTGIGVSTYSVPIDIVKHLSVRSIEAFRPLSTMWHRFLGMDGKQGAQQETWISRVDPSRRPKRRERSGDDTGDEEPGRGLVLQQSNEREKAVSKAMQQVLGQQDVGFRSSQQEQALHAVVDRQTPLVVVLPTGGGKSLLFSVPACMDNAGVTVVVVPYRALIEDLVSRLQKRGIDCIEWKHGESSPAAVVIVSADAAGDTMSNGNFIGYANMLSGKGLLRRVVVDECHLIITSSDWRPKLALLRNLRLLPCPIVLLTATLPPVREGELATSMLLPVATYIRASTVRPNTRYYVSWCERGKVQDTALAMCRRQQQLLLDRGEKGIVYCRYKQQCEDLAKALECAYYHAGDVDRAERLGQWLMHGGLIVATSALGTGVDFPGIVYIVHVGMPWSMIDYAQESGRGGRAGERVDSVVLVEHGEAERTMKQKSDDLDVQAMGTFIIGSGCRRGLMSGYLDGKRVECNDVETAGCDRCGEGVRGWQDAQREANIEWQQVQEVLDEVREGCVMCWMASENGEAGEWQKHKVMQCRAYRGVTGKELDTFRRGIWDRGGSHSCRRCWISQKYCVTGEDVEKQCQWPNVVVPLARVTAEQEAGSRIIRQCGYRGQLGGNWKEYAGWLGKRHQMRVWGEYFSNAMVVTIRVILFWKRYTSSGRE